MSEEYAYIYNNFLFSVKYVRKLFVQNTKKDEKLQNNENYIDGLRDEMRWKWRRRGLQWRCGNGEGVGSSGDVVKI